MCVKIRIRVIFVFSGHLNTRHPVTSTIDYSYALGIDIIQLITSYGRSILIFCPLLTNPESKTFSQP